MVNIERGRHRVQIHVLMDIARTLGVELAELLPRVIPSSPDAVLPSSFAKQLTQEELAPVSRLLGDQKGDRNEQSRDHPRGKPAPKRRGGH